MQCKIHVNHYYQGTSDSTYIQNIMVGYSQTMINLVICKYKIYCKLIFAKIVRIYSVSYLFDHVDVNVHVTVLVTS